VIEVENELEEAVHFILLHNARLAEGAHDLQEGGALFSFELLYRHVRHVNNHDVVAQIGLVETDFGQVKLSPRLPNLGSRYLLLLLGDKILHFGVQTLLHRAQLDLRFIYLVEALRDCLAVS